MSDPKFPVVRADLTRLPFRALAVVAKVIESGDRKYQAGDWIMAEQRIDGRRDLNSALRHIGEFIEGKDVDEDSGESPLAHAAARLLFLLEREARGIKGGGWRIGKSSTAAPKAWDPLADLEAIARQINQEPTRCTFPVLTPDAVVQCAKTRGHSGAHVDQTREPRIESERRETRIRRRPTAAGTRWQWLTPAGWSFHYATRGDAVAAAEAAGCRVTGCDE